MLAPAAATATDARIEMSTDTREVYVGDTIVLDIEARGLVEPLDVSALRSRPAFLRETAGSRIAVVDGRVVDIEVRRMVFDAPQPGLQRFGPLLGESSAGPVSSGQVSVRVRAAPSIDWQPSPDDVAVEIALSTHTPFVGERIDLDIALEHRHAITAERIVLPDLSAFDVLPMLVARRTVDADGMRRIAWRYQLYPRRSGEHVWQALRWSGTAYRSRSQRAAFEREARLPRLDVRPARVDGWWLPSPRVTLAERWSVDPRRLAAGDEVERTLTLRADDLLPHHLPDITMPTTRGLESVAMPPLRRIERDGDRVAAISEFRFRVTAIRPGPAFLDTIRVAWWDTRANRVRSALAPARRIEIATPADSAALDAWQTRLADTPGVWARVWLTTRAAPDHRVALVLVSLVLLVVLLALHRARLRGVALMARARLDAARVVRHCRRRRWTEAARHLDRRERASGHPLPIDPTLRTSLAEALYAAGTNDAGLRPSSSRSCPEHPR